MEKKQVAVKPIIDRDTLLDTRSKLKICANRKLMTNGDVLGPRIFRSYRVILLFLHYSAKYFLEVMNSLI